MMKMFVNKFPVYQYHTFSRKSGSLQLNVTTLHCVYLQRSPGFLVGSVLLIVLVACVVLLCVFKFWVPCCDVRYDFRIKTMFGFFINNVNDVFLPEMQQPKIYLVSFWIWCLNNYCKVLFFAWWISDNILQCTWINNAISGIVSSRITLFSWTASCALYLIFTLLLLFLGWLIVPGAIIRPVVGVSELVPGVIIRPVVGVSELLPGVIIRRVVDISELK